MSYQSKNGQVKKYKHLRDWFNYGEVRQAIKEYKPGCLTNDTEVLPKDIPTNESHDRACRIINGEFDAYCDLFPEQKMNAEKLQTLMTEFSYDTEIPGAILEKVLSNISISLDEQQAYEIALFCTLFAIVKKEPKDKDFQTLRQHLKISPLPAFDRLAEELLNETMPNPELLQEELAEAFCTVCMDYYEKVMNQWVNGSEFYMPEQYLSLLYDPNNGLFNEDDDFVTPACLNWLKEQEITKKIADKLNERLSTWLPGPIPNFPYALNIPDMGSITVEDQFGIGVYMAQFDSNVTAYTEGTQLSVLCSYIDKSAIAQHLRAHRDRLIHGGHVSFFRNKDLEIADLQGNWIKGPRLGSMISLARSQLCKLKAAEKLQAALRSDMQAQLTTFIKKQFSAPDDATPVSDNFLDFGVLSELLNKSMLDE